MKNKSQNRIMPAFGVLAGLVPLGAIVSVYGFFCRVRLDFGHWPSFGGQMADNINYPIHLNIGRFLFMAGIIQFLVFCVLWLVARSQLDKLLNSRVTKILYWTSAWCFMISIWTDPGNLISWFLD